MKVSNIIFTNHAIQRIKERKLSLEWAQKTIEQADSELSGKENGTTEFRKSFNERIVTCVCKRNADNEWVLLSIWVDPPFPGTKDAKKRETYIKGLTKHKRYLREMETAGFWKKLWLTFKQQAF